MNESIYGIRYVRRTGRSLPAFARRGKKNHKVNQWSALYAKLVISIDTSLSYFGILLNKYKINISYYPKNRSSVTLGIGFSIDRVSLTPNKLEPALCTGNTKFEYTSCRGFT
jgi:hypothetical protein